VAQPQESSPAATSAFLFVPQVQSIIIGPSWPAVGDHPPNKPVGDKKIVPFAAGIGTLASSLDWGSHQVLWPWFMEASHSTFFAPGWSRDRVSLPNRSESVYPVGQYSGLLNSTHLAQAAHHAWHIGLAHAVRHSIGTVDWQILCSARRRALAGSARRWRDMGRGPLA
jgi:hypothetical protein